MDSANSFSFTCLSLVVSVQLECIGRRMTGMEWDGQEESLKLPAVSNITKRKLMDGSHD